MIRLQRLTGMRPSEVMEIRPADITFRTDGLWAYRPRHHKNEHHDIERIVLIGPQAQEVLQPWLDRESVTHCFSPTDAVEHQHQKLRANRKTPVQPSQRNRSKPKPKRKPGKKYSENALAQAIRRGIDKLNRERKDNGLPVW